MASILDVLRGLLAQGTMGAAGGDPWADVPLSIAEREARRASEIAAARRASQAEGMFGPRDPLAPAVAMPESVSLPIPSGQPRPLVGFEPAPGGFVSGRPSPEPYDFAGDPDFQALQKQGNALNLRDDIMRAAAEKFAATKQQFPERSAAEVGASEPRLGAYGFGPGVGGPPPDPAIERWLASPEQRLASKQARSVDGRRLLNNGQPAIHQLGMGTIAKRPEPRTPDAIAEAAYAALDPSARAAVDRMRAAANLKAGLPADASGPERDKVVRTAIQNQAPATLAANQADQRLALGGRLREGLPINEVAAARLGITTMPESVPNSMFQGILDQEYGIPFGDKSIPDNLKAIATSRAERQVPQRIQDSRFFDSLARDVRAGRLPVDVYREIAAERLFNREQPIGGEGGGADVLRIARRFGPDAARLILADQARRDSLAQGDKQFNANMAQRAAEFSEEMELRRQNQNLTAAQEKRLMTQFAKTHDLDVRKFTAAVQQFTAELAQKGQALKQRGENDATQNQLTGLATLAATENPELIPVIKRVLRGMGVDVGGDPKSWDDVMAPIMSMELGGNPIPPGKGLVDRLKEVPVFEWQFINQRPASEIGEMLQRKLSPQSP